MSRVFTCVFGPFFVIVEVQKLCYISYDRVLEISTQLGESVFSQFMEDDVVCPAILQKGLFTTSAVDNIDHNPSHHDTVSTSNTSLVKLTN
jgi:hypothetical protein